MTPSQRSCLSLLLVASVAVWTGYDRHAQAQAPSPSGDASSGTKRALLIGINKYKAVPKLQGSLNDIETMRQILLTRWGFADKHIVVVTDEAATRTGMLTALEQLAKDTGPNDTVYFHFSGHGSQVEDLNGDEPDDHLDETLVPQDGRTPGVRDITDDELDAIFARMAAKNAFIVLDSCHSGTATRSLDIRTRSIPQDNRTDIYRKAEDAKPKTRAIVPVITSRYVVMTGAASHQEALDGPVDGRYHGFFTYSLAKSLSSAAPGASPREVFTGVEQELKRIQTHFGRTSMPEPQLEAPPDLIERTLFGASPAAASAGTGKAALARLPWLEVIPGEGGLVTLINGPLLGAAPGSTWSLYPPGETRFAPGLALAVATVTQISGKDATAKVHSSSGKLPPGTRAVSLLPAPTGQRIAIRLLEMPPDTRKVVETTLRTNVQDVDLVGPDQPARFSVDVQENALRLLAADGMQVVGTFGFNEPWGAGMATVISRSANASELLTLDNPSSQLKLDVRVATAVKPKSTVGTRGITVIGDTQAAQYHIRTSDKPRTELNSLQLEVRVNTDAYLTIVDVDSEGGVNLLFPNNYQQNNFYGDGFVRGGDKVLIPDSIKPGNKAGFYWDYSPPKGTDTIRVFTSTDLPTAQMIRDRIKGLQGSGQATGTLVATRSVSKTVESLRSSLAGVAARGIVIVADATTPIPGEVSVSPPSAPLPPASGLTTTAGPATPPPSPPQPAASAPSQTDQPATVVAASAPAADWAAASITIVISD